MPTEPVSGAPLSTGSWLVRAIVHEAAQGAEPERESLLLELVAPALAFLGRTVEARAPVDEGLAGLRHRRHADRGDVAAHRRGLEERIGVGPFAVGVREQLLADGAAGHRDMAHRADLGVRLAVLDRGLRVDTGPGIVPEWPNHRPDRVGRMIEHDAVEYFHGSPP